MSKKTLSNTLVSVKDRHLTLKVDLSAYVDRALTDEMRTGENHDGSYRIAGSGGSQYVKIDGLDGVMVKLDVIVSYKKYQELLEKERQQAIARQALEEINTLKKAVQGTGADRASVLDGIDPAVLAQAIALAQTLQAQKAVGK